jgi:hypothetical protein
MTIGITASQTTELKTKSASVVLGHGVTINQKQILGPGEFDVAGVQCEGIALGSSVAFLLRAEDLVITYLSSFDTTIVSQDRVSETAILVLDLSSDPKTAAVKQVVTALEPSYVVLVGGNSAAVATELGLPKIDGSLKVTRSSLPIEGVSLLVA